MRSSLQLPDHAVRVVSGVVAGVAVGLVMSAVSAYYIEVLNPLPVPFERGRRTCYVALRNRVSGLLSPLDHPLFELIASTHAYFESLGAAISVTAKEVTSRDTTTIEFVTAEFFRVLDAKVALGRLPSASVDNGVPEVLVSRRFFLDRLGGDRSNIGRVVVLDSCQVAIVGVAAREMEHWRRRADVWGRIEDLKYCAPADLLGPGYFGTAVIGVLSKGADVATVQRALQALTVGAIPELDADHFEITLQRASSTWHSGATQAALMVFLLGSLAAFAAALMSVVGLQLSVIEHQRGAWVVRRVMGATPGSLSRLLASDNLATIMAGLVAAGATVTVGARQFDALALTIPGAGWRVMAFALVVVLVGISAGAGLVRILGLPMAEGTRDRRGSNASADSQALLLAIQVSFATVIVGVALLCWTSVWRLETVQTGSRLQDILTVPLNWDSTVPEGNLSRATALADLEARVRSELRRPAGIGSDLPFTGAHAKISVWLPDGTRRLSGQHPSAPGVHAVTPGYLPALGARLLEGRHITPADTQVAEPVAIVSEAAAEAFWPGRSAVGATFSTQRGGRPISVVGVVANIRYESVHVPASPEIFLTYDQLPVRAAKLVLGRRVGPGLDNEADLLKVISHIAGVLPGKVISGRMILARQHGVSRLLATAASLAGTAMLIVCGATTLAIATYLIEQRRAEIGVRLALGGTPNRVAGQIMWRPATAAALGCGIGIVLTVPLGLWLRVALYGVAPLDVTATAAGGVLVCAASWLSGLFTALTRVRAIEPADLLHAL